ncbi:MAG: hypothetical protein KUG78_20980 [Kangiellaceae bacterium]|nr:hypothetical protein [Kangiellaceae bacterium]
MRLIFSTLTILITAGCADCGPKSDSAEFARSLSDSRLKKLYESVVALQANSKNGVFTNRLEESSDFKDLKATRIKHHPGAFTNVFLSSCSFDDKVLIKVIPDEGSIFLTASGMEKELLWANTSNAKNK